MKLDDIKKVGIVGAGTMGYGIAINFALNGYPVMISDVSEEILKLSGENIESALAIFVEEELITSHQSDRALRLITATTDLEEIAAKSDFITEAIVERSGDKKELFNRLDKLCPPHTIIASNTSWLMLSDFGSEVNRQDKIVITHYFAPPHIVPGVEICGGPETSAETFKVTCQLMDAIGKVPVRVLKERTGHIINRLQDAMRHEANILWAEGVATAEDIELGIISTCGFRMPYEGSMMHYDLAGVWKWPKDVLDSYAAKEADESWGLSRELVDKIRQRYAEGKPWFINPDRFGEIIENRDRDLIRRLKALYRNKDK
ncbi:3-hydroxyacyl-CoA dehydrogenase family protein [Chloroflexota bacterium]